MTERERRENGFVADDSQGGANLERRRFRRTVAQGLCSDMMAVDFSVSQAPVLWSSLLSWLKPPYLYVLTNGIIITIVASSKYYRNSSHHEQEGDESASPRMLEVKDLDPDAQFSFVAAKEEKIIDAVAMVEDESELKNLIMVENFDLVGSGGDEDVMMASANSNRSHVPLRMTESENLPPKDSRFDHRESVKASTRGTILILFKFNFEFDTYQVH